ncbi:hypothetical protein FHG87_002398 [Trinorchestia longiramus]|nr:hypothetical protein FHG87_002398 [Trinorchestia longiramus]
MESPRALVLYALCLLVTVLRPASAIIGIGGFMYGAPLMHIHHHDHSHYDYGHLGYGNGLYGYGGIGPGFGYGHGIGYGHGFGVVSSEDELTWLRPAGGDDARMQHPSETVSSRTTLEAEQDSISFQACLDDRDGGCGLWTKDLVLNKKNCKHHYRRIPASFEEQYSVTRIGYEGRSQPQDIKAARPSLYSSLAACLPFCHHLPPPLLSTDMKLLLVTLFALLSYAAAEADPEAEAVAEAEADAEASHGHGHGLGYYGYGYEQTYPSHGYGHGYGYGHGFGFGRGHGNGHHGFGHGGIGGYGHGYGHGYGGYGHGYHGAHGHVYVTRAFGHSHGHGHHGYRF